MEGPLGQEVLREHVQLVLTDRSALTAGRDFGVTAVRTWRIADLGAKHAMLLAALGWGSMPLHMVRSDLRRGGWSACGRAAGTAPTACRGRRWWWRAAATAPSAPPDAGCSNE